MNDSETDALDALIVRNIVQVNAVWSRVQYGIGPRVLEAMDEAVKEWADAQGWQGKFDSKEEWLWFAPRDWMVSGPEGKQDGHYAYLQLATSGDEEGTESGDQDWLVTLLCAGVGSMGIRIFRGDDANIARPVWRRLLATTEVVDAMVALGFVLEAREGSYFLRIPFEAAVLADGIEQNDLSTFLVPLKEALEKLPAVVAAMRPVMDVASKPADSGSREQPVADAKVLIPPT